MRLLISILCFFAFAAIGSAAGTTVAGYVFELSDSCRALSDLTVTLTPPRSSQWGQLVTKTDDKGKFSFEYPGSGSVYLEVFQGTIELYGHVINLDKAQFPLSVGLTPTQGHTGVCLNKPDAFNPSCPVPQFPAPLHTEVDTVCGLAGTGVSARATESVTKNNFCASGTPKAVTFPEMVRLQGIADADPNIESGRVPPLDRSPLKKLGEGDLVVLQGFILKARQESFESANCGKEVPNSPAFHDIHIAIVSSKEETDECKSVVAEMSPHHRPPSWTASNIQRLAASKAPVRVTGQLFFDSPHRPCVEGQRSGPNPARASLWEIHPIYNLQVCVQDCDHGGHWVTFQEWVGK